MMSISSNIHALFLKFNGRLEEESKVWSATVLKKSYHIEKKVVDDFEDTESFHEKNSGVDWAQQVIQFVEALSFVTVVTVSQVEPL